MPVFIILISKGLGVFETPLASFHVREVIAVTPACVGFIPFVNAWAFLKRVSFAGWTYSVLPLHVHAYRLVKSNPLPAGVC